jgi:uncharacterized protein (DUF1697 family)
LRVAKRNQKKPVCYAAFFRGINVGGKNIVPMAALIEIFRAASCSDLSTYIQSGNVLFAADPACLSTALESVRGSILRRFGFTPAIAVRTAAQLTAAIEQCPFVRAGIAPEGLHIGFLSAVPDKTKTISLDANRSPGDAFVIVGDHLYLNLVNGMGKTKLTNAWFDSQLGVTSTFRNWRTLIACAARAVPENS